MINGIVAIDQKQGIGLDGSMPWPRLSGDMKWFKTLTTNHVVIMGSTTWNSLPCPLPNRINIVISRYNWENAHHIFDTPEKAIAYCQKTYPDKQIFIIGGQALFDSTMHFIDKFFITEIDQAYDCDKFFDLTKVKTEFSNVVDHSSYSEKDVTYKIKEYSK